MYIGVIMKKDFLEMLMSKVKVVDFDKKANVAKLSLFTVQDVFSLAVYKKDLFVEFLKKLDKSLKAETELDVEKDLEYISDGYNSYSGKDSYTEMLTDFTVSVQLCAIDVVSVFQPLFEELIKQSTETETFKELIKQFESKTLTVKFVSEWDEEVHSWTY